MKNGGRGGPQKDLSTNCFGRPSPRKQRENWPAARAKEKTCVRTQTRMELYLCGTPAPFSSCRLQEKIIFSSSAAKSKRKALGKRAARSERGEREKKHWNSQI